MLRIFTIALLGWLPLVSYSACLSRPKALPDSTILKINDKILNFKIRKILNKPTGPILFGDVKRLDSLNLAFDGSSENSKDSVIHNIDALSFFTSLNYLNLANNAVKKLAPLSELRNLKTLNLHKNKVSDLSQIISLTNLKDLNLFGNQVYDLAPLQYLTGLACLNLSNNEFVDISALSRLVNLKELWLNGNHKIENFNNLHNLSFKLETLGIAECGISNLDFLNDFEQLHELIAFNNQINNLLPLANKRQLNTLYIFGNQISDVNSLETMYQNGCFRSRRGKYSAGAHINIEKNHINLNDNAVINTINFLKYNGVIISY